MAGSFFAIASSELVLGFAYAGVAGEAAETRAEALAAFRRATGAEGRGTEEAPKVLILAEDVAAMIDEEVTAWQIAGAYPLIVEVPALSGKAEGRRSLIDAIREAVGVHV